MTEPHAVINRLTTELQTLSWQVYRVSDELAQLHRLIGAAPTTVAPIPPARQVGHPGLPVTPGLAAAPVSASALVPESAPGSAPAPIAASDSNWIGKLLAAAGVAVTLVGVVLLLALAAQAGILGPPVRIAGGIGLAAGLVGVARRLHRRPGGRIGAIALAATGVATAYLDVIAITTVYSWVPAPVGLVLAAVVGVGGLMLSRCWESQHLGVLTLLPMIVVAPVLTDGIDMRLVGFMMTLSAAALLVQAGRDWNALSAARIVVATIPLLLALVVGDGGYRAPALLGGACALAAALSILGGVVLMAHTSGPRALAVLSALGTLPVLAAGIAMDRVPATVLATGLALGVLSVVVTFRRLPAAVARTWSVLAAIAALIAVTTAFDGYVQAPVLLSVAVIIAIAGRFDDITRWAAGIFGVVGVLVYLAYTEPAALVVATAVTAPRAVSTLVASVLVVVLVVVIGRGLAAMVSGDDTAVLATVAGGLIMYAVTAFTVTFGVLTGGTGAGFVAGHTVATICWMVLAAGLVSYALRLPEPRRRPPIMAGLALTGAATAKLFLFDLATLAGMWRVVAFIVVGLMLLAMGTSVARSLAAQSPAAEVRR